MADTTIAELPVELVIPTGTEWLVADDGTGAKRVRMSAGTAASVRLANGLRL